MTEHVIEARHIVNRFGMQTVHDGVDVVLKKGEILGIVGGSGSGKSVLLRTLLGLNKPVAGTVKIKGKDIFAQNEKERRTLQKSWGVLFQESALFSGLTVLDNVAFPMREHTNLSEEAVESLSLFKLGLMGLDSKVAAKMPSELSGGMMRRAGLARALALDPDVLFLDEPTDGLDPVSAAAFDQLILKLRDILGLSVFIITHDLDTLTTICDRVGMLAHKKLTVGTLDDMMASDDEEIQAYFNGPRMRTVVAGKKQTGA